MEKERNVKAYNLKFVPDKKTTYATCHLKCLIRFSVCTIDKYVFAKFKG